MYPAYIALVVCFVLVIVLHAWFVRRLSALKEQARADELEYHKLRMEMIALSESVSELDRGRDSNQVSILALEREIEEIKGMIREFLKSHEDLREEFGLPEEAGEPAPQAEVRKEEGEEGEGREAEHAGVEQDD